ncbi:MAG TPA: NADP-dependent malic enzyme [Saprospiraceae bacterium]|nr:NADP-dependent malic enzyme [Saprospiraceae bacterium]HMV22767.1 NADP-dependent malic enzyme [Saprospiraceae bacterium]HMX83154.1 NADP-dependent malic enzyme [Saprospiraceae bacterium]HMX85449.1 NADP-dependent malic enzyme [Saprospiraceae bacterium]HMZ74264.1 NADP-dependent malic enzyme [Saprospiraceae bacterium]
MDYFKESLKLHKKNQGKIEVTSKIDVQTTEDLSLVYSPGVAEPCIKISQNQEAVWDYTLKSSTVAIVSDGSAVLGLGNIGARAAIPVMEGKAMLFKKFADINGFPICLDTQDTEEIIRTVRLIAPVFGGINLEDINAPKCFEIENRLQDLGIPVFHDDQHGTAIVVIAGLINACKVVKKKLEDLTVVVNGAGAAGVAIAKMLKCIGFSEDECTPVKELIMCDSTGIIHRDRKDLNKSKLELLTFSNSANRSGSVKDAIVGADVFIGVSVANLLTARDIKKMNKDAIIFALANPVPEIMPEEAYKGGAAVVGTGRSDLPNQVNNVLGFPGVFRGALDAKAKVISPSMKLAAAYAIAKCVKNPSRECVIPPCLDLNVAKEVAKAVKKAALKDVDTYW